MRHRTQGRDEEVADAASHGRLGFALALLALTLFAAADAPFGRPAGLLVFVATMLLTWVRTTTMNTNTA